MGWTILPIDSIATGIIPVTSTSSLPAPTLKNGVMTIVLGDAEYIQTVDVNSPFPLALPGVGKRATWTTVNGAKWNYTGNDECFRDKDAEGDIEFHGQVEFTAVNGNMFDILAVTGSFSFQGVAVSRFRDCKALGIISGGASGNGAFNTFFGSFTGFSDGLILDNLNFDEQSTMFVDGNNAAKLDYDGQTVNFTLGETVTGGTSGATGIVDIDDDSGTAGTLVLSSVTGTFQNDEALTGSSTGVAVVNGVLQNTVMFTVQGTATSGSVNFINLTFFASANETLFDLKSEIESSVDSINLRGNQSENILNASAFAPGSLDTDSAKVFSFGNTFIPETQPSALLNFKGNSTVTAISAASTDGSNAVLVAGTWTCTKQSLFTCTAAGRITSQSERPFTASIDVIGTLNTTTADTVAVYIALNGTPISDTGISQLLEAGDRGTIPTMWELVLNKDDFLEVHVENQTDGTDITVIDIIFRVRS